MSPENRTEDAEALDRRFVDFIDGHVKPVFDPTDRSLMGEGVYSITDPDQILPFDRVDFAEYREDEKEDEEVDPDLVEEVEITLFTGELEVVRVTYNLFTYEYSFAFLGQRKVDIADSYRYFPAHVIKTLEKLESEGKLVELVGADDVTGPIE